MSESLSSAEKSVISFLTGYDTGICELALQLRELILKLCPGIIEQLDGPAKMIMYCYGQKYAEMVCTIIPSKKGLKLGFYKGVDLPDPEHLLQGTGKISRYAEIRSSQQIKSRAIKNLLKEGLKAYRLRVTS